MFAIIGTLLALDAASKEAADRVVWLFNPALNWIQRWLPLFYVPTLVVVPLAIQGIPGECIFHGLLLLNSSAARSLSQALVVLHEEGST
jgi:hypothetical protein